MSIHPTAVIKPLAFAFLFWSGTAAAGISDNMVCNGAFNLQSPAEPGASTCSCQYAPRAGETLDSCGKRAKDDSCWCDELCVDYGDCCPDVMAICICSDLDLDNICDNKDNCKLDFNPDQGDANGDGVGDACPPPTCADSDGDGSCDDDDNCPLVPNPDQVDRDGDSIGDFCEVCIAVYDDDVGDDQSAADWAVEIEGDCDKVGLDPILQIPGASNPDGTLDRVDFACCESDCQAVEVPNHDSSCKPSSAWALYALSLCEPGTAPQEFMLTDECENAGFGAPTFRRADIFCCAP